MAEDPVAPKLECKRHRPGGRVQSTSCHTEDITKDLFELAASEAAADTFASDPRGLELAPMQTAVLSSGEPQEFAIARGARVLKHAKRSRELSFASIVALRDAVDAKRAFVDRFA